MKKIIAVVMTALILAALAVPAFAAKSPDNNQGKFNVTVGTVTGKGNIQKIVNDDGTITLKADPENNEAFEKWVLSGDYEIVSGSLTSSVLVIRPKGDIKADATFTGAGVQKPDNSDKSPATGTYTVLYVMAAVAAISVAVVARKRIAE